MTANLTDLADRVARLTGPDREVDAAIAVAAKVVPHDFEPAFEPGYWRAMYDNRHWYAPEYTASIDAAMTLVPEGYDYGIYRVSGECQVEVGAAETFQLEQVTAATPALALTAAALRARAKGTSDDK